MEKLTIAASSGTVWLTLVSHFAGGLIALVAGFIALVVAKGGRTHKTSGMVFSYAMIFSGLLASGIAAYEGNAQLATSGVLVGYLVFTAITTVKPVAANTRGLQVVLMVVALTLAAKNLWTGSRVWQLPGHAFNGIPAGMILFMGTICLLAAIGDFRMIRAGGIDGPRRLARHLWRMCYAFFIATGSFFIGQMKFVPAPIRIVPLMFLLGLAPLLVMLYWLWRVRLRRQLKGMILSRPATSF